MRTGALIAGVGPLVLVGGAYTSAATVRRFGGNKFPLLVEAGHAATIRIAGRARTRAGLAYGPLPQGEVTLRHTHRTLTFVACRAGRPGENHADGTPISFWSGGVVARRPGCVPLDVYVDDEARPRHVGLPLGHSCSGRSAALRLAEPPATVLSFCRSARTRVPVMCPSSFPRSVGAEVPRDPRDLSGRDFTPAAHAGYLATLNDPGARTADVGHAILAAQPGRFSLSGKPGALRTGS